jgi:hypothetical protein
MDLNHILHVVSGLLNLLTVLVSATVILQGKRFIGGIGLVYCFSHFLSSTPIFEPLLIMFIIIIGSALSAENSEMWPFFSLKKATDFLVLLITGLLIFYVGWGYSPGALVPLPEEPAGESLPVGVFHLTIGEYRIWAIEEQDADKYLVVGSEGERTYNGKLLNAVKLPDMELPEDFLQNYKNYRLDVSDKGEWTFDQKQN